MGFGNRLRDDDAQANQPSEEKAPAPGQPGVPSQLRADWNGDREVLRALAGAGYVIALMFCVATLSGLYALRDDAKEFVGLTYMAVPRASLPFDVPPDRAVFDTAAYTDTTRISAFDRGLLRTCMPIIRHEEIVETERRVKTNAFGRVQITSRSIKRGRYVVFGLDEADSFLACAAKRQKQRFCQPHYRKRFAARLKELVSLRRLDAGRDPDRLDARSQQVADLRVTATTGTIARTARDHVPAQTIEQTGRGHVLISRELGTSISRLSRSGLLDHADFGTILMGPPEPVAAYMRAPRQLPRCRTTLPAAR